MADDVADDVDGVGGVGGIAVFVVVAVVVVVVAAAVVVLVVVGGRADCALAATVPIFAPFTAATAAAMDALSTPSVSIESRRGLRTLTSSVYKKLDELQVKMSSKSMSNMLKYCEMTLRLFSTYTLNVLTWKHVSKTKNRPHNDSAKCQAHRIHVSTNAAITSCHQNSVRDHSEIAPRCSACCCSCHPITATTSSRSVLDVGIAGIIVVIAVVALAGVVVVVLTVDFGKVAVARAVDEDANAAAAGR